MDIAERIAEVRNRIAIACEKVGRRPDEVTLVAVSKGHPIESIEAAAQSGISVFGENKIQEAKLKIPRCPSRLKWHMIGHLQSNKVRDAVAFFDVIQSVDSVSIAAELDRLAEKSAKYVRILIEVNLAGEASKFGFAPGMVLEHLEEINSFPRLELGGFMGMAPWTQDMERVRPLFRQLRGLADEAKERLGIPSFDLSMGMSGDFEVAIEEGATIVRVGSAIFGDRPRRELQ